MAGRRSSSRGRQRIPMRLIENQDDLYASFSKRRRGLYNKASELSTLCGADVGVVIFSPTGNPFSFWHPSMDSVIARYRNDPNNPAAPPLDEANTRERIENLNRRLDEVLDEKEQLKQQDKQLDEIDKTREKGYWWEQTTPSLESFNKEQLNEWKVWFEDVNSTIKNRMEELKSQNINATYFDGATAAACPASTIFPDDHNVILPGPSYAPTMMGMIRPSHGPSYAPTMMGMIGPCHEDQVPAPSHYIPDNNVLPQQAHELLPFAQHPLACGGSTFPQFRGQLNYFPLLQSDEVQDPSSGCSGTITRDQAATSTSGGFIEPLISNQSGGGNPSTTTNRGNIGVGSEVSTRTRIIGDSRRSSNQ